jgi:hypothetical protein
MAAVIRIKRRRDAPSESFIDLEPVILENESGFLNAIMIKFSSQ